MLAEWHITPDYIVNNWTDELLTLMIEKMAERKKREVQAMRPPSGDNKVSDSDMFGMLGNKIKVVKE